MSEEKPVIYILHGDDPVEIDRFVDVMTSRVSEGGMAEMNLNRLDGRTISDGDLKTAALSLPFLAERRLVILDQAQIRLGKGSQENLQAFLDGLPPTTALVLIVRDEFIPGGANKGWQAIHFRHWLWPWIEKSGGRVFYRSCRQPPQEEMAGWIRRMAETRGGKFSPGASIALADQTGSDTQYALQEIDKLLIYTDRARAVEPEDVMLLTAPGGQVNVFDMVDELSNGNSRRAVRLLQGLLEETDTASLFGMVVRQFRLLIQSREILDEGGGVEEIVKDLIVPNFVARKLVSQAGRFDRARLEHIYHRLLELDESIKTGQLPADLALELLVAGLNS